MLGFMVTMLRRATWKIAVYGRDHGVPHFHIEGRDFRCSLSIESGVIIVGAAPPAVLQEARIWAAENRSSLMTQWLELNG